MASRKLSYDVVVIGGGPGGYVAAIRAAQLGFKTAVVDKRKGLGGTCLNVGCIPSKALLDSSELYHLAKTAFKDHGIGCNGLSVDLGKMMKRKDDVVRATVGGIDYLMKKHSIDAYQGVGSFVDQRTVRVNGKAKQELTGRFIIIATGSEPTPLPFAPFDGKRILSSTEALELTQTPNHLIVIGGGFIGLEIGSVYARLGARVSIIEFLDAIVPSLDRELGNTLQKSLSRLGLEFHLRTKVSAIKAAGKSVTVSADNADGKSIEFKGDYVLVAVGRRPYTDGLNLAAAGIEPDHHGRIGIDDSFRTSSDAIFAIGDVVAGPMLAHKAEEEGVAVAEIIAGQSPSINHNTIPGVVYTWPEVASVGKSEEQLKEAKIDYKTGKFPFKASGRARAANDTDGFIKVLSDPLTDEILGVHMIGPRCADMIAEAVVAMEFHASAEDIGRICHPHPTFTESFKEAALMATDNRPLHL